MSTTLQTTAPQQQALARVNEKTVLELPDLRKLIGSKIDIIRDALPEKMKGAAPRYAISLITACQQTPKLAQCTALSLFGCLTKAANLGLEIGGECWLIPRNQRDAAPRGQTPGPDYLVANFQIGWKGVVALLYRNPRVIRVAADSVRKGDEFELLNGTESRIVHKYGKVRGEAEAYYCVVKLTGGESIHKVMTVAEIDDHRKRFSDFGTAPNGDRKGTWKDNFDAMALKTIIILGAKTAPRSVELPNDAAEEEVTILPDDVLPQGAVQPKQIAGEVACDGNKKQAASLEDLDVLVGILSDREEREGSDIEFEMCELWSKRSFAEMTAEERLEAYKALEKRAARN